MKVNNHYVRCRTCKKNITFGDIETHDKTHRVIIRLKPRYFAVDLGIFIGMEIAIIVLAVKYLESLELIESLRGLMPI